MVHSLFLHCRTSESFQLPLPRERGLQVPAFPCSVPEYSVFRVLAAESGWDEEALQGVFLNGLCKQMKDELAMKDKSYCLDTLISLAIWLDKCMQERNLGLSSSSFTSPVVSQPNPRASVQPLSSCLIPIAGRGTHEGRQGRLGLAHAC